MDSFAKGNEFDDVAVQTQATRHLNASEAK